MSNNEIQTSLKVIAHIHTDFTQKFGIPRQSNVVKELMGQIIFEPEYRNPDAIRGLSEYEYIWLLWRFDVEDSDEFRATVRPPRLGGNERMGVFATRSPYRPNPIGLSSVRLEGIEMTSKGPVINVSGIDMRDNTAIYDIKPYLSYADSHENVKTGFAANTGFTRLRVDISDVLIKRVPSDKRDALIDVLAEDPRPSYQNDKNKIYGLDFSGLNVRFKVEDKVLTVLEIDKQN